MGPELAAVGGGEGEQAVIDRGDEDAAVGDRRGRASGHAQVGAPFLLAGGKIERDQRGQAVVGIERGAVGAEAAADIGAVVSVLWLGVGAPQTLAVGQRERRDHGVGVHGEDRPVQHDRLRHDDLAVAAAFADAHLPRLGEVIVRVQMAHQVSGIAAGLRPCRHSARQAAGRPFRPASSTTRPRRSVKTALALAGQGAAFCRRTSRRTMEHPPGRKGPAAPPGGTDGGPGF